MTPDDIDVADSVVIVVRTWREPAHPIPFRATITVQAGEDSLKRYHAASAGDVCDLIREALDVHEDHR